jgi:hypothetical protein
MELVRQWLIAFLLTVAIEAPIVTLLLRGPLRRRIPLAVVAQLASHPAVWFVFFALPLRYTTALVLSESWAVLSEATIYALLGDNVSWRRALGVSLLANTASYLASFLLR